MDERILTNIIIHTTIKFKCDESFCRKSDSWPKKNTFNRHLKNLPINFTLYQHSLGTGEERVVNLKTALVP